VCEGKKTDFSGKHSLTHKLTNSQAHKLTSSQTIDIMMF